MENIRLGEVESRFAELIWRSEPVSSGELVKLCQKELEWKKSTTYTVLRKLCDRGIFKNEYGVVRSLISKDRFNAIQSEKFVEESFDGSLPNFIAAFTSMKKLSPEDIDKIKAMIDGYGEK